MAPRRSRSLPGTDAGRDRRHRHPSIRTHGGYPRFKRQSCLQKVGSDHRNGWAVFLDTLVLYASAVGHADRQYHVHRFVGLRDLRSVGEEMINQILLTIIAVCAVFNTLKPYWPRKEVQWPWMADYEALDEESR